MSDVLNEIRNVRFRMAKRSGYEVVDVDEFIDLVEQHVTALLQENRLLRADVERLRQQLPQ
ncbi:DivIVA domain-containing protein [Microlunatus soli]|uniref:Cell wall synthesis protein Wag31 n=1 Tax=Microlunatus soli TaxID=630515 RepID=A0A1H1PEB1_9ACTN|nr:DivIVA domain-containing protein [Microlunatus soli]SDS09658.1 DivIVA domain-containing protein [Microlunatus soli]